MIFQKYVVSIQIRIEGPEGSITSTQNCTEVIEISELVIKINEFLKF